MFVWGEQVVLDIVAGSTAALRQAQRWPLGPLVRARGLAHAWCTYIHTYGWCRIGQDAESVDGCLVAMTGNNADGITIWCL